MRNKESLPAGHDRQAECGGEACSGREGETDIEVDGQTGTS